MKLWWFLMIAAFALIASTTAASDLWEEDDDKEVLVRTARGVNKKDGKDACRYSKGPWSDCEPKTNMKTRTLTLKKDETATGSCEKTKLLTKKCKKGKACRYEKGTWTSCVNLEMIRKDNLKPNSDPSCEKTRSLKKKCKPESANKKKDRSNKKVNKQQQQ